jgi:OmpA-OmpF porin, OOP family
MKQFALILLLLISLDLYSQRETVKTYYSNGIMKSSGRIYSFSKFDKRIPKKYDYFKNLKKKDGEWKFWNENGKLIRIENYKALLDVDTLGFLLSKLEDVRDGKWTYFNDDGLKYREEIYQNGTLANYVKGLYRDSVLIGKITYDKGMIDTTLFEPVNFGKNLIINPEFDIFYYKPVSLISHGKSKIEELIPFWKAPGYYTPDYLSNLRFIDVLSKYYLFEFPLPEKFNYAGFALYKESELYSEYIQGKLAKPLESGHVYCLRIGIALTSYSGFSVDRLGFHFSSTPVSVGQSNESAILPQVVLSIKGVDNTRFVSLCDYFVAAGGEQFITIGRFISPDKMEIRRRGNVLPSQFGIDKSAYYLLENIDLHEIKDSAECSCNNLPMNQIRIKIKPDNDSLKLVTDLTGLKEGKRVILKHVNFEFNSFKLESSADTVLNVLLKYLTSYPAVRILISGHTDDIGGDEYNLELSKNRARSVYDWMVKHSIDSTRLEYIGFGNKFPLNPGTEEKIRTLNRRVEIKIIKRD